MFIDAVTRRPALRQEGHVNVSWANNSFHRSMNDPLDGEAGRLVKAVYKH